MNFWPRSVRSWLYERRVSAVAQPAYARDELRAMGYLSQNGQDRFIFESYYSSGGHGVFVDIGAHDGISLSNSAFFEQKLGWSGVAVEPLPEVFCALVQNRNCEALNVCVGALEGDVEFVAIQGHAQMLSGIADNYHPRHLDRISREIAEMGGSQQGITIPCWTFDRVMSEKSLTKVDYLNIDIEGGELELLKTINFGKYEIDTVSVENNYRDRKFRRYMSREGFDLVALAGDEIYRRRGA